MNPEEIYSDIINLPYKKSSSRKQMSLKDRAAQFAPFSALTGHNDAVEETARLTEILHEPDEHIKEELNQKLMIICENLNSGIKVTVEYFEPDLKKDGGKYITKISSVKKFNEYERTVILDDGSEIPVDSIASIESELFNCMY